MTIREKKDILKQAGTPEESQIVKILDMWDASHRQEAAKAVADNKPVAIFAIQFGIVFSATEVSTAREILTQVKGVERTSPVPIWIRHPKEITDADVVDFERIHPELHAIFRDPDELAFRTQGFSMLKFPVKPESKLHGIPLHSAILDTSDETGPWLQFFYIGDNQPCTQRLIEEIYNNDVKVVAISSLNLHKQAPPRNDRETYQFCQERGVGLFITDDLSKYTPRKDSYPIMKATDEGFTLMRPGNVHPDFLHVIWGDFSYPENTSRPEQVITESDLRLFFNVWSEFPSLANLIIQMAAEEIE